MENENKKYYLVLVLVTVVMLLIVGGVFYWSTRKTPGSSQPITTPSNNSSPATVAATKQVLSGTSKFFLPEVADRIETANDKLPQEIRKFINPDSINFKAESVTYVNGKEGYSMTYDVNIKLLDYLNYLQKLITVNNWTMLNSTYANKGAITEAENEVYQIQFLQLIDDVDVLPMHVMIHVIKK